MTLTEFLTARIDEDLRATLSGDCFYGKGVLVMHPDVARALAEAKAKRRIVGELETAKVRERVALYAVMRHLAAVYADHPDYDESWKH